jgi:SAM-dependent methyltransferase
MNMYCKYHLYEKSVQSPDVHAELFTGFYKQLRGKNARHLREDFCGTFAICCEWVKLSPKNTALGLDLDPEPIAYGKVVHYDFLTPDQQKRISIRQADVLNPPSQKSDMILAGNFSFCIFKDRPTLLKYFKSCLKSLNPGGILFLEAAGGPGMIEKVKESKTLRLPGNKKFVYYWDQKAFDPISCNVQYSIHFKLPNGKLMKDAFTYDWRLWSIPEIRELFAEAGFKKSAVFWETEHNGVGTGEFVRTEKATNDHAWIAYLAAIK